MEVWCEQWVFVSLNRASVFFSGYVLLMRRLSIMGRQSIVALQNMALCILSKKKVMNLTNISLVGDGKASILLCCK